MHPTMPDTRRKGWDILVLTASNEEQAAFYRGQIACRRARGLLDPGLRCLIVPDPGGVRVGSGCAALNALRVLGDDNGGVSYLENKRILMIHSGGDSRRVPQYSACGKLFSPVPRVLPDGTCAALFDELLRGVAAFPACLPPGMLTLAGDILLYFPALDEQAIKTPAAAFSVKAGLDKGANHGVFVTDKDGAVTRYLHKLSVGDLTANGAADARGRVQIDTGAVWFNTAIMRTLYDLGAVGLSAQLSFYADLIYPMAAESTLAEYLRQPPEGVVSAALERDRRKIWDALGGYRMCALDFAGTDFIHFGTTAELLELMNRGPELYAAHGWTRAAEHYAACNSTVDKHGNIGKGSYIENSTLIDCVIGRDCVISGLNARGVCVPDDTVIHALPQNDGGVAVRIYGTRDNPKDAVLFGKPLGPQMAALYGTTRPQQTALWEAPLYLNAVSPEESLTHALALRAGTARVPGGTALVSLEQSFHSADTSDLLP